MTTTGPVVVAVPAQDEHHAAVQYGAREVLRTGGELRLVHCYQLRPTGPETELVEFTSIEATARTVIDAARERAEHLVGDPAPEGVTVTARTAHGAAVHRLVEAGENARMVVLERRDLSRARRAVTRSTTSGVAARAHVPVVVVPPGWSPAAADSKPVTVAVDDASSASSLLRTALDQARTAGTTLRVFHAWWFPTAYEDLSVDPVGAAEWTERARHEIEEALAGPRAEYPDVPVEIEVHHGRPADLLLAEAERSALLVVGRHDPAIPLGSHLGPVARTVLREAACPVLVAAPVESHHHGHRPHRHQVGSHA
ncbi:universal stress protein [Nocardioides taihuensis]|uniref:Universal stress protein n=1 Tax=Nocardioides taihuensis TaxID=1835606 RepID=A0ABW0BI09_9ACTN